MDQKYDFSGWATRNDLVCADGRTIRKDAFKHCDGKTVPLVWNHRHDDPANILGHALLENRDDGVYAYCFFNNTESGNAARELVQHGDVESLSIYANGLKQTASRDVMHGDIKEVSLVIAGANPGAFIDFVDMAHADDGTETEMIMGTGEEISLYHSDEKPPLVETEDTSKDEPVEESKEEVKEESESEATLDENSENSEESLEHADKDKEETIKDVIDTMTDKQKDVMTLLIGLAIEEAKGKSKSEAEPDKEIEHSDKSADDETVQDVVDTMTEKQKTVMAYLISQALKEKEAGEKKEDENNKSEGGQNTMKHNVFEAEENKDTVLSHSDRMDIINLAKSNSVGSLRTALNIYAEQNSLQHGISDIDTLFPDYKDVRPGAPELIERDQGWVDVVMRKVHKSPISRIRTRQVDARGATVRAHGYTKPNQKRAPGNASVISRTTDPQTVYRIDALYRDDIIDITDFDIVAYQYNMMRENLNEEVALAIMVGDGRDPQDEKKISEDHIRSIWNDDETYTIHADVDIEAARDELQGEDTSKHFGDNYVYAEAIITAALYSREQYKGTGTPDFFCTPHLVNVMLLARDFNGRRIYNSKADLAAALNVKELYTAEQFENLVRVDEDLAQHKLLGIFVNLADYTVGSTKGGEITKFDQFDIDFNQHKYLIETRISGALTRIASAIALEEPVNP